MSEVACVHVVDDEPALRDSLEFLLAGAGYQVRTYPSAETFSVTAGSRAAGCVLTDLRLSGSSGLDLIRSMSAQGSDLPVIVMTGHGDLASASEALRDGAADFLEKPFTEERLLGSVADALAGPGVRAAKARARLTALEVQAPGLCADPFSRAEESARVGPTA